MNWIECAVFFPSRLFVPDGSPPEFLLQYLQEYFDRYSVDTSLEPQTIDGVPVVQSYAEREPVIASIFGDDLPRKRFRTASIFRGTIPFEPSDGGYILRCCWPETFINDINRDPQPEPEWFEGVRIVDTNS